MRKSGEPSLHKRRSRLRLRPTKRHQPGRAVPRELAQRRASGVERLHNARAELREPSSSAAEGGGRRKRRACPAALRTSLRSSRTAATGPPNGAAATRDVSRSTPQPSEYSSRRSYSTPGVPSSWYSPPSSMGSPHVQEGAFSFTVSVCGAEQYRRPYADSSVRGSDADRRQVRFLDFFVAVHFSQFR